MLIAIIMLSLVTSTSASDSHPKPCTQQEEKQAGQDIDHLENWDKIYRSYRNFSHCDDGHIAEGYSDAVGKLLAEKWIRFARLAVLLKADPRFQEFVLRHIDGTLPPEMLDKIKENAQLHCPGRQTRLCRLITRAASVK